MGGRHNWWPKIRGGGALVFQAGYHPTLNTYFSGTKTDSKYAFLNAFFFIVRHVLSIFCHNDQKHAFFLHFARFCTPKRRTRVHCLVLKTTLIVIFLRGWYPTLNTSAPPPGRRCRTIWGRGERVWNNVYPESAPLPLYYQFYFSNKKKCIYFFYNEPNLVRKLFQFSNLRNNQNYEK